MSWGNKILIAFFTFAGLIGVLVYSCMQQNFELVSKDYYKDEIAYQQWIDGTKNANKISKVLIEQSTDAVTIKLPNELNGMNIKGDVWFYCATNSAKDKRMPLQANELGSMTVPKTILAINNYEVKINWTANNQQFYYTQNLIVK